MSQRQNVQDRIREVVRQHPGWTPSQVAIFLQGEQLRVTSEDVRRVLARTTREGDPMTAPETPRYTVPREVRRSSSLPFGLLFGLIIFLVLAGATWYGGARTGGYLDLAALAAVPVLLVICGAVASRGWASGARAGMTAALFALLLLLSAGALLYYVYPARFQSLLGTDPGTLNENPTGMLVLLLVTILIADVIGLLFGWLGAALFGRKRPAATFD